MVIFEHSPHGSTGRVSSAKVKAAADEAAAKKAAAAAAEEAQGYAGRRTLVVT